MNAADQLPPVAKKYLSNIRSGWKLRLYFLKSLPSAWWWGIKIKSVQPERCEIILPYSWRTKNPFQSIYFAAQAGAGELSTGILANVARLGKGNISMLIVKQKATFMKKANSTTTFTCEDGLLTQEAVRQAIETNLPQTATMLSTGRNAQGEIVSTVQLTWSFKLKN